MRAFRKINDLSTSINGFKKSESQDNIQSFGTSINPKKHTIEKELRHDKIMFFLGRAMIAIVLIASAILALPFGQNFVYTSGDIKLSPENALSGKTIVIDAGHGGFDPGAVGIQNILEAPLNLTVSKALSDELKSRGVTVLMTREDENALAGDKYSDMKARSKLYEESGADVGVSIHMNKFTKSNVSGPMVFYYPTSKEGPKIAQSVQDSLDKELDRPKSRKASSANYFMLRESKTLSILVECGFLSNPDDVWLLQKESHQKKIATAIANGLNAYFLSIAENPEPSPSPTGVESAITTGEVTDLCPGLDPNFEFEE